MDPCPGDPAVVIAGATLILRVCIFWPSKLVSIRENAIKHPVCVPQGQRHPVENASCMCSAQTETASPTRDPPHTHTHTDILASGATAASLKTADVSLKLRVVPKIPESGEANRGDNKMLLAFSATMCNRHSTETRRTKSDPRSQFCRKPPVCAACYGSPRTLTSILRHVQPLTSPQSLMGKECGFGNQQPGCQAAHSVRGWGSANGSEPQTCRGLSAPVARGCGLREMSSKVARS